MPLNSYQNGFCNFAVLGRYIGTPKPRFSKFLIKGFEVI
jgi:hypothetical protein